MKESEMLKTFSPPLYVGVLLFGRFCADSNALVYIGGIAVYCGNAVGGKAKAPKITQIMER
ncbi:MAG: hypothetical protein NC203_02170 [Firmicutes bacterium]|nr:hypothetical protein [Bacillota bacterium]